ncbi:hypothetical protein [Yoonia sp. BS5-3]|uniref:Glycosyl transferase family 2 n=1 Tax=Yoonia phaeophyticola TaxID=3137369 RepID=A0ABZ2V838_9RHOB
MTHYPDLSALSVALRQSAPSGPLALILIEDEIEIESTIKHHLDLGFSQIIACGDGNIALPTGLDGQIDRVDCDVSSPDALATLVNTLMPAMIGRWVYYGYNAEYLFYPFSKDRSAVEMLGFVTEERRNIVASYVVDLYARDLGTHPNGVSTDDAYFDKSGYYALARQDIAGETLDRQLDVFGGLRWRFEEHIAQTRRRIDRVSLFKAKQGLLMSTDRLFNDPEYNTIACPWHHSLTAAVASFRTAKALRRNPGSRQSIDSFHWRQSEKFNWQAQQLLDLGLLEPGQWF